MLVTKNVSEVVRPSTPSAGGVVELGDNDQIIPQIYTSILLLFGASPAQAGAAALLKKSLAETLCTFYPLAGRYRPAKSRSQGLQIECNDEGVLFHEAWVDCDFEDSVCTKSDFHPDLKLLVPQMDFSADVFQVPLVLAQITHFECGRVTLGFLLHHNAMDGHSIDQFLGCWARATLATSQSTTMNGVTTKRPHLDRSLLKARKPPAPTSDHPEFVVIGDVPKHVLACFRPCTAKIFHFTPSAVDELRARASSNSSVPYTRFQVLAAHIWRAMTYSRDLVPTQDVRLGISVDCRERFNPPLPDGYFGNVLFYGLATCEAGKLVASPLSVGADIVKAAIAKVDDAFMRSAIDWASMQHSPRSVFPAFCRPSIDLGISSWSRLSFYDMDFGWGKPSHLRLPCAFDGGVFFLPSSLGAGHVDAYVGLDPLHMPKFEYYINHPHMH